MATNTFIQVADLDGLATGKPATLAFRDGLATDQVTDAVLRSASGQWERPGAAAGEVPRGRRWLRHSWSSDSEPGRPVEAVEVVGILVQVVAVITVGEFGDRWQGYS